MNDGVLRRYSGVTACDGSRMDERCATRRVAVVEAKRQAVGRRSPARAVRTGTRAPEAERP